MTKHEIELEIHADDITGLSDKIAEVIREDIELDAGDIGNFDESVMSVVGVNKIPDAERVREIVTETIRTAMSEYFETRDELFTKRNLGTIIDTHINARLAAMPKPRRSWWTRIFGR